MKYKAVCGWSHVPLCTYATVMRSFLLWGRHVNLVFEKLLPSIFLFLLCVGVGTK